jgi:hypothetical protein
MLLWFADADGLYFHTASLKPVCGQMEKNPKEEIVAIFRVKPCEAWFWIFENNMDMNPRKIKF